ncbi:MAG TPA: threonine-phosphate decarboxylase [Oceanospirillaceae bacterium]|nr:threonine-phosphate decarboxylase [Oceanospirillaceae bacterium]
MTQHGLIHGGDLQSASQRYGRPIADWVDLSTGINVYSYPVPEMKPEVWQRLPYLDPQLVETAAAYYGNRNLLLAAGSQPVIELLPEILHEQGNQLTALLPDIGYQEHHQAWRKQGPVATYSGVVDASDEISARLNEPHIGHLLLINPNNPTGIQYTLAQIHIWAQQLASKQGYVIIDEAFIDCAPAASVVQENMPDNLVVLRSFGKFFGLAGVRLGALVAKPAILQHMAGLMGPWSVNGPAQAIATVAYSDQVWQQAMRTKLATEQAQQLNIWQATFTRLGAQLQANTALFRSFAMPKTLAEQLHTKAANAGILIRPVPVSPSSSLVRLGNIDLTNQSHQDHCLAWLASLVNNIG